MKNRAMTLAGVGTLTTCLLLLGVGFIAAFHLEALLQAVGGMQACTLYLREGMTEQERAQLEQGLLGTQGIGEVRYTSRQDSLLLMSERLGETPETLLSDPGADNPFLASYHVQVTDTAHYGEIVGKLRRQPGVVAIKGSTEAAGTLQAWRDAGRVSGLAVAAVLLAVSVLIVCNTVKLTVFGRRREIGIMKLVGASDWYIRIPYLAEGVFVGLLSAGLAVGTLRLAYGRLLGRLVAEGDIWRLLAARQLEAGQWLGLVVLFAVIGCGVGCTGGGWFVRKYLRV